MKSHWQTHKGRQILYVDLSNFRTDFEGLKAELESTQVEQSAQLTDKSVLIMVDFRNTQVTPDVVKLIRARIAQTDKHVYKAAIIGLTGIRKILFDLFNAQTKAHSSVFSDIEQARDWLVADG